MSTEQIDNNPGAMSPASLQQRRKNCFVTIPGTNRHREDLQKSIRSLAECSHSQNHCSLQQPRSTEEQPTEFATNVHNQW